MKALKITLFAILYFAITATILGSVAYFGYTKAPVGLHNTFGLAILTGFSVLIIAGIAYGALFLGMGVGDEELYTFSVLTLASIAPVLFLIGGDYNKVGMCENQLEELPTGIAQGIVQEFGGCQGNTEDVVKAIDAYTLLKANEIREHTQGIAVKVQRIIDQQSGSTAN